MLRNLKPCKAASVQVFTGSRLLCWRGVKAFDDLMVVVEKVTDVGARQERKRETCDALKAGKLYLKADDKVRI